MPKNAHQGTLAAHRLHVERHRVPLERTAPAVAEPDEFQAELLDTLAHYGADDSVQARAVAATGKDSHSHEASLAAGRAVVMNRRNNMW